MAELVLDGVSTAGGTGDLKGVTLTVGAQEYVTVIDLAHPEQPSPLLRAVAGLIHPTAGDIRVAGRSVIALAPSQRGMALVPSVRREVPCYGLYPMTVRENLEFPLRCRRLPRAEIASRVTEIAQRLDLTERLDRKIHALAGGLPLRVAVARALIQQPQVCLLDDPLAGWRPRLAEYWRRSWWPHVFRAFGATVVHACSDPAEACVLGDRVAVLVDGQLHQVARPRELFEHPASAEVAEMFTNPPISFLSGLAQAPLR